MACWFVNFQEFTQVDRSGLDNFLTSDMPEYSTLKPDSMVCAVFRRTGGTYLFPQERHRTLCVKLLRHHTLCVKLLVLRHHTLCVKLFIILFPQQRHHTLTMCKATYHFVPTRTSPYTMCKATSSPCTVVCKATYYFVPTRTSPCTMFKARML